MRSTSAPAGETQAARSVAREVDRAFRRLLTAKGVLLLFTVGILVYVVVGLRPEQDRYASGANALTLAHEGMLNQETGLRGYLLVGGSRFLAPYEQGRIGVSREDQALDRYFGSDPSVAPGLLEMRLAQQAWISQWAVLVAAGQAPTGKAALDRFLSAGKALFDAYRAKEAVLGRVVNRHRDSLSNRETAMFILGLGIVVVFGVVLVVTMLRQRVTLRRLVVSPVEEIVARMEAIAGGDLETGLEPAGASEFRRIGESINLMRAAMAAARARGQEARQLIEAQSRQLRDILAMSREIGGSLNLGYVLRSVATAATTVSGFPRAVVWLRPDEASASLIATFDTAPDGPTEEEAPAEVGVGVVGQAVRYGRVVTEVSVDEASVEVHPERALRDLALPLVVGAQVIGAIELVSSDPHLMVAGSLEVLQTLASHAAAAIEAARLHTHTLELAQTDGLTGMANRRRMDTELAAECERAARYDRPLALIMFDVDQFKAFNDTFGHLRGDEVLQELAQAVKREVRVTDTLYRYGGEEFAVLTRETDPEQAMVLAERLRKRIEEHFAARGSVRSITASFGVGCAPPAQPTPESLIASADAALYRSKLEGRNRVTGPAPVAAGPPATD